MYQIRYTCGRNTVTVETLDEALAILRQQYPDMEYGHDGDLSDDGDRTLVWLNAESAANDSGQNAVASIQ